MRHIYTRTRVRLGIALTLMICVALASLAVGALDLHSPPEFNQGLNELYEDGSFILSIGDVSIAGCLPWEICN